MTLRALICLTLLLLMPVSASAFGDCDDAAYRRVFDDRLSARGACQVMELTPITIGSVSTPARVLRFDRPFDASDDAWIAALNDTLDRVGFAASALEADLRIQPVTILLTNLEEHVAAAGSDAPAHTGPEVVHGAAMWGRVVGECPVSMYKIRERIATAEFTQTIAHELFHCIQFATWPTKALEPNGWWWIEGSAEYFGMLAVPEHRSRHYREFGLHSQPAGLAETGVPEPLDYENGAFFSWLHQQGGGPAVGDFLANLPAGGAPANAQALIDLDTWSSFTEDLIEGNISIPGGGVVPKGRTGQIMAVQGEDGFLDWTTDAYRTFRVDLEIAEPGTYELTVEGGAGLKARLRQGEGEWRDFPIEVEGCRNSAPAMLYAVTTEGPVSFTTSFRKMGECSACEVAGVTDSCLAGTWTLTGGGPLEWLRANGMSEHFDIEASEIVLRILRNGTYVMNPVTVDGVFQDDDVTMTGDGQSIGISGNWGAADGVLHVCPLSGEVTATTQVQGGPPMTMVFGPGEQMQMTYLCSGDTLNTTLEIPGVGPMDATYTRSGP